jgi:hypothetical protein
MHPLTDLELLEKLYSVTELDLLELLGVTSEEIVQRFSDMILDNRDKFRYYLEEVQ